MTDSNLESTFNESVKMVFLNRSNRPKPNLIIYFWKIETSGIFKSPGSAQNTVMIILIDATLFKEMIDERECNLNLADSHLNFYRMGRMKYYFECKNSGPPKSLRETKCSRLILHLNPSDPGSRPGSIHAKRSAR